MESENLKNNLNVETKKDAINRFIEDKLKKRKTIYYILLVLGINSLFYAIIFVLFSEILDAFLTWIGFDVNKLYDFYLYSILPGISLILLAKIYKSKFITRESIEKYINEDLEYHEPKYITFFKICILSIIAIGMIILLISTITFIIKNVLF